MPGPGHQLLQFHNVLCKGATPRLLKQERQFGTAAASAAAIRH